MCKDFCRNLVQPLENFALWIPYSADSCVCRGLKYYKFPPELNRSFANIFECLRWQISSVAKGNRCNNLDLQRANIFSTWRAIQQIYSIAYIFPHWRHAMQISCINYEDHANIFAGWRRWQQIIRISKYLTLLKVARANILSLFGRWGRLCNPTLPGLVGRMGS